MQKPQSSDTGQRNNVLLNKPADVLAALPHLLGLYPAVNSVVVIGLHGVEPMAAGLTIRVDVPELHNYDRLAAQVASAFTNGDTTKAFVVLIGGSRDPERGDLPYRALANMLEVEFDLVGIPIVHSLWAAAIEAGADWRCYGDHQCGGILDDPRATELAATAVLAGAVTAASRDDLVATLAPIDQAVIDRRARLLETARRHAPVVEDAARAGRAQLALLREAIDNAARTEALPVLTDNDVVALADALSNNVVRDACAIQSDEEHYRAAERLMAVLVRTTIGRDRAEAASLVALYAYRRGNGILARIALDNAEQAEPGHRFASLLRRVLQSGLPPERLTAAFEAASRQAAELLAR